MATPRATPLLPADHGLTQSANFAHHHQHHQHQHDTRELWYTRSARLGSAAPSLQVRASHGESRRLPWIKADVQSCSQMEPPHAPLALPPTGPPLLMLMGPEAPTVSNKSPKSSPKPARSSMPPGPAASRGVPILRALRAGPSIPFPAVPPTAPTELGPRLNPLRPPWVSRRTVMLETRDTHAHNEQRVTCWKRREHDRQHGGWRRPVYGDPWEKETYRREIREWLQSQMREHAAQRESARGEGAGERAQAALAESRLRLAEEQHRREQQLASRAVRDHNKRVMELRWEVARSERAREWSLERQLLQLQSLNWSGTLT